MDEILYTVQEVADILKVKRRYVYELLKNGKLRGVKLSIGSDNSKAIWRIPVSEINAICARAYDKEEV